MAPKTVTKVDGKRRCRDDVGAESSPSKKPRISKAVRQNVWEAAFGDSGSGTCFVCQRKLSIWSFDVCHKRAAVAGGKIDYDNLFVGCHECNLRQGTMDLEDFMRIYHRDHVPKQYSELWEVLLQEEASSSRKRTAMPADLLAARALLTELRGGLKREQDLSAKDLLVIKRLQRCADSKLERDALWGQLIKEEAKLDVPCCGAASKCHCSLDLKLHKVANLRKTKMRLATTRLVLSELRSEARREIDLQFEEMLCINEIRNALRQSEDDDVNAQS